MRKLPHFVGARRAAGLALALFGALPVYAAPGGAPAATDSRVDDEAPQPLSKDRALLDVCTVLRLARRTDAPARDQLVGRICAAKEKALEPLLTVLVTGEITRTTLDDKRQLLSGPQRELVLAALRRQPEAAVRAAIDRRLTKATSASAKEALPVWRAAAWTLGAIGGEHDITVLLTGWRDAAGREAPALPEQVWRACFTPLLARTPTAFTAVLHSWRKARPEQLNALIEATGDAADPNGLAFLADVIDAGARDDARLAIGQVRRVGRSYDDALDLRITEALRKWVDVDNSQQTQPVLQALGELRDADSLAICIELLEREDRGLRESALWALRRNSGLNMSVAQEPWTRWLAEQESEFALARDQSVPELESEDIGVVIEALRKLRALRIEGQTVASWITPLLSRSEVGLRVQACESIAELDARSAVPALVEALDDEDERVSDAAWKALRRVTGRDLPLDSQAWREIITPTRHAG